MDQERNMSQQLLFTKQIREYAKDMLFVDKQGSRANKTGKYLENQVEDFLCSYGIESVQYRDI